MPREFLRVLLRRTATVVRVLQMPTQELVSQRSWRRKRRRTIQIAKSPELLHKQEKHMLPLDLIQITAAVAFLAIWAFAGRILIGDS